MSTTTDAESLAGAVLAINPKLAKYRFAELRRRCKAFLLRLEKCAEIISPEVPETTNQNSNDT